MAKIYISSTFEDLKVYRKAVYDVLNQLGHKVIAMEDYVASDKRPLQQCLTDVASCDIYIVLLAWRYGYIPPNHEKSITELEYQQATKSNMERLIFILDETAAWPPNFIDSNRIHIDQFKKQLMTDHMVQKFKTPDDLKSCVSVSMRHVQKENHITYQQHLTHLTTKIDDEIYLIDNSKRNEIRVQQNINQSPDQSKKQPRVFISHSTKDEKFVERNILNLLNKNDIEVWYSKNDIETASEWERCIVSALESCDWYLVVMSTRSAKSEWVKDEVHWAFDNRPHKIIPVLIENCKIYNFHLRMPRIQYVDFRKATKESCLKLINLIRNN